jgi:hypothetical protein
MEATEYNSTRAKINFASKCSHHIRAENARDLYLAVVKVSGQVIQIRRLVDEFDFNSTNLYRGRSDFLNHGSAT